MTKKKNTEITIRSSAAEYLTYVAATGDAPESYEMRYENFLLVEFQAEKVLGIVQQFVDIDHFHLVALSFLPVMPIAQRFLPYHVSDRRKRKPYPSRRMQKNAGCVKFLMPIEELYARINLYCYTVGQRGELRWSSHYSKRKI